ncbi:MAG: hypothetical protein A2283_03385 [Lentisphaerae bacterium RIFOXYA12_FULL_48_11]|nr:MAG: hypothetical protein A2283_03385 [Lentisphaerae bacterium RIFOXYA12_FULL_48_11]
MFRVGANGAMETVLLISMSPMEYFATRLRAYVLRRGKQLQLHDRTCSAVLRTAVLNIFADHRSALQRSSAAFRIGAKGAM